MATKSSQHEAVLISVRTPYAELLINGVKTYELRRRFPEGVESGTKMLVYASGGTKGVIGECVIHAVHRLPLDELWKLVCRNAMLSWEEFKDYYSGLRDGYAIEVIQPRRYSHPVPLEKIYPDERAARPPQSYCYL